MFFFQHKCLKSLPFQKSGYLCSQLLVSISGSKHFRHVHHIGNLCHTGKKDSIWITVDSLPTFFQTAHSRGTGPGSAVTLTLLFADDPHPLSYLYFSSIHKAVFINGILRYKFFKTIGI